MRKKQSILLLLLCMLLGSCALPTTWFRATVSSSISPTDSGFRPQKDGFNFANYGAGNQANLEAADIQRMFGDVVCTDPTTACRLTPTARIWMDEMNRAMANGHCEGMAVLSQYFYYGILQPQTFGAATTDALVFDQNTDVSNHL